MSRSNWGRPSYLLTRDELRDLTGYQRPSDIARWLGEQGWVYVFGADDWPRVARGHADMQLGAGVDSTARRQPRLRLDAAPPPKA